MMLTIGLNIHLKSDKVSVLVAVYIHDSDYARLYRKQAKQAQLQCSLRKI